MEDYAIVVGISKYPGLNQPGAPPFDLKGPDGDAQAIRDWLVDANGGGLKPENVWLIRTAGFPETAVPWDAQPQQSAIRHAFLQLRGKGYDKDKMLSVPVGRRLYLYLSGHGFSQGTNQPALLTAEAMLDYLAHLYANAWIEWFRAAGFFEEYVVWVDCCMNGFSQVQEERLPNKLVGGDPGRAFVGVAANSRSALEAVMPDGAVHGVFTWTLLQGLKGRAAEQGVITGESLRRFLYNAMIEYLPPEVREASEVDVRPAVQTDFGIVFRTGVADPAQTVRLRVEGVADGSPIEIWGGQPHAVVRRGQVQGGQWQENLPRGLYVVVVPAAGLRHGFEVTGSGNVEIAVRESGAAVEPPGTAASFILGARAANAGALITVVDHAFERIQRGTGQVASGQPPGLYKVRVDFGQGIASVGERVVVLDRDLSLTINCPPMVAAAPIAGTAHTHEWQVAAFDSVASAVARTGLSLMARYWTPDALRAQPGVRFPDPFEGLDLVGPNGASLPGWRDAVTADSAGGLDPMKIVTLDLPPGGYTLQQTFADGRIHCAALVVVAGWLTQCVIRRSVADVRTGTDTPRVSTLGDVAVFMRGPAVFRAGSDEDATLEAASVALAEHRAVFEDGRGTELWDLLNEKYQNPIAGIVGGHLTLLSLQSQAAARSAPHTPLSPDLLNQVVTNLRRLVGSSHPDVEALSLKCTDPALRARAPFLEPPMFRRSWDLLVEAAADDPALVPHALWDRVSAVSSEKLPFVWSADERTRTAHRLQLRLAAAADLRREAAPVSTVTSTPLVADAASDDLAASGFESVFVPAPTRAAARRGTAGPTAAGADSGVRRASDRPEGVATAATRARTRARLFNVVPDALTALMKATSAAPTVGHDHRFCAGIETRPTTGRSKAAVLTAYRWPAGSVVTVGFLGGEPALHRRIEEVARQWVGPGMANITFAFGPGPDADIRIAFEPGHASWSYLGTMARDAPPRAATVNFGWLAADSPDDDLARVVLHEFGHALGLTHEYLHPDEAVTWDRQAVSRDLSAVPGTWDDQAIDVRVIAPHDPSDPMTESVDPRSIMICPVPGTWTHGQFSVGFNASLTDIDKDYVRVAYPW